MSASNIADNPTTVAQVTEIIQAAATHNVPVLEACLKKYSFAECESVDVQDPETGYSPLHAAIASTKLIQNGTGVNGDIEDTARATVQTLLESGAIWNQLDLNNETPGCIAYRLGHEGLYQLMVDAGVRAEMLLNRLDGYEPLEEEEPDARMIESTEDEAVPALIDGTTGISPVNNMTTDTAVDSTTYLSSALSFVDGKLLDKEQNGVMMAWESGIMSQSADALLYEPDLKILNIGFGMGIIDTYFQSHTNKPHAHHIIEAHPDVLKTMKDNGWTEKANVIIHEGKWQEVLPQLVAENETFDAIYFDTFAESYSDFREFFSEHVIGLLSQKGRWSFFDGMGADRQISYDVYQKVVELDLFESGFDVEWIDVELPKLEKEWDGVKRKYWSIDKYRLPVCKFMD